MIERFGWYSLSAIVISIVCGCSSNSPKPHANFPKDSNASPANTAPPTSTAELEAKGIVEKAGGKLKRDAAGSVTDVDLRGIQVDDALATTAAKLSSVQSLSIDSAKLTTDGWSQLSSLKSLRQLDLRECPLTNEWLAAVLSNLSQLRALRLSGKNGATQVDDGAMEAVAKCKDLKVLALDYLWISDVGLDKLVGLSGLSELYLANTLVDDAAADSLAKFAQLKKLRLARTQITSAGLAKLTALKSLEDLDLSECSQMTDDGLQGIGEMLSLKRLNLWRDQISDQGLERLAKLSNLEWLNLDNTQLSDAGLVHLSGMQKLAFLHLGSTSVSDQGMDQLKPLISLKDLKVTRTAVTEAGVAALRTALPNTEIQLKYSETE